MNTLTYNQLVIEAFRLGRRIRILDEAVSKDRTITDNCVYEDDLSETHKTLTGIGHVLRLLGETPNAHINAEAMQAISEYVEYGTRIESRDWAKPILESDNLL